MAQTLKDPPEMQETWVRSLGWEDPLEEGMVTHSNILDWRLTIVWATLHGLAKHRRQLGTHSFTHSPHIITFLVVVVQLLSRVQFFATPWTAACQAPLSSTISLSLLKFMLTELVMLSNHTTAFLHTRNIIDPKTKKWISYNLSSRCLL